MKTKKLILLSAAAVLSIAPAFAELSLPVNLDFQDETQFPVGPLQSKDDFRIYIAPREAAPGIEVANDPEVAGNKLLVIRSNGTSETNRLKIMLPAMTKPFEYQFRCKVEGEIVPGNRSLLSFYVEDQWDKPARIVIPSWDGNLIHAVVDRKFKSAGKDLAQWRTIKVAVNTDGQAGTPDTYSLFVDGEEVLSQVPMERDFETPLSFAEIALDFNNAEDVAKLKFLIDDIRIGSPAIGSPAPAR